MCVCPTNEVTAIAGFPRVFLPFSQCVNLGLPGSHKNMPRRRTLPVATVPPGQCCVPCPSCREKCNAHAIVRAREVWRVAQLYHGAGRDISDERLLRPVPESRPGSRQCTLPKLSQHDPAPRTVNHEAASYSSWLHLCTRDKNQTTFTYRQVGRLRLVTHPTPQPAGCYSNHPFTQKNNARAAHVHCSAALHLGRAPRKVAR